MLFRSIKISVMGIVMYVYNVHIFYNMYADYAIIGIDIVWMD